MRRVWLVCFLAAQMAIGLGSGTAGAQTARPDFEKARQHYMAGRAAQQKGDTETAVREFIASYEITKDPKLFKNIAQSYEAGGKKSEAVVYYRRYVTEVKGASDAAEIQEKIEELEGPAPPPPIDPVRTDQMATPPPPTGPVEAPPSFADEGSRWTSTVAWISVAATAVLVSTGAVLALSANSREEDLLLLTEYRTPGGDPYNYSGNIRQDWEDKLAEAEDLDDYSKIAFIAAGGTAALAITFFVIDAVAAPDEDDSPIVTGFITPHGAGVAAGWSF